MKTQCQILICVAILLKIELATQQVLDDEDLEDMDAAVYRIKSDLCVFAFEGVWPAMLSPIQIDLRKDYSKIFLNESNAKNMTETCQQFSVGYLDMINNETHYNFCWYMKYGFLLNVPKNYTEMIILYELMKKFLPLNEKPLTVKRVKELCNNYNEMDCKNCLVWKEKLCFFADDRSWPDDIPVKKTTIHKFFYFGDIPIPEKEIRRKCLKTMPTIWNKKILYPPFSKLFQTSSSSSTTTSSSSISTSSVDTTTTSPSSTTSSVDTTTTSPSSTTSSVDTTTTSPSSTTSSVDITTSTSSSSTSSVNTTTSSPPSSTSSDEHSTSPVSSNITTLGGDLCRKFFIFYREVLAWGYDPDKLEILQKNFTTEVTLK